MSRSLFPCIINFFGAKGAGKTTVSAGLLYFLRKSGYKAEIISKIRGFHFSSDRQCLGTEKLTVDRAKEIIKIRNSELDDIITYNDYIIVDSPIPVFLLNFKNKKSLFNQTVLKDFNRKENVNILLLRNSSNEKDDNSDFFNLLSSAKIPCIPFKRDGNGCFGEIGDIFSLVVQEQEKEINFAKKNMKDFDVFKWELALSSTKGTGNRDFNSYLVPC